MLLEADDLRRPAHNGLSVLEATHTGSLRLAHTQFSLALAQLGVFVTGWRTRKRHPGSWRHLMGFGDTYPLSLFFLCILPQDWKNNEVGEA